jgi:PAS domain S-box-containing protein
MKQRTLLILDTDLRAVLASHSFYQRFSARPEEITGRHLHEVMERTWDFPALRHLVSDTLAGRTTGEIVELERDLPRVGRRVIGIAAQRLVREDVQNAPMILLSIEDITETRRAERRLAAEHAVARVLARAASFDEAAPALLDAFCAALGVEMAEVWAPADDGRHLALAAFHSGASLEGVDAWREAASRVTFAPGVGLPGRVWQSRVFPASRQLRISICELVSPSRSLSARPAPA